jgi:hypothetical protein
MNKHDRMYQQIEKHGANLNAIFNTGIDNIKLCKKLNSIEIKAHHATTCLCNTNTLNLLELNRFTGYDVKQATEDEQDAFFDAILNKVDKILKFREKNIPVFINHDPRGYALKIKDDYVRNNNITIYQDFGGYGILVPEFDGN